MGHTGFRIDHSHSEDELTLAGEFYRGLEGILGRDDAKVLGGNVLARWNRKISNTSELQLQTSYERSDRRVPLQSDFHQKIFDVDFQHQLAMGRHNLTWGAGYRWNRDTTVQTAVLRFVPPDRTYPLGTAFVQDEVSLGNDVKVTFGSKLEHNDFTGFEAQPSVRALWAPRADQMVWAAVSRAVRTPTRYDSDIRFGPPGFLFVGNPNFKSEAMI